MKRISYLIFTATLLLSVCSMDAYGNKFHKPADLVSLVKKEFEVYAPRRADLERASEAVLHARRVYQRYFGKEAPKIAIVLFDDPAQTLAYDESKFRERGMGLLKWKALGAPFKNSFSKELGVVISESPEDSRVQILGVFINDPVAGIKLEKGDIILAVNNSRITSLADFGREMKAIAIGSQVTLHLKREGRDVELKYNRKAIDATLEPATFSKIQSIIQQSSVPISKSIISHEAMHKLMREGLKNSLSIPAWYNEGLATLAELPESVKQHRLQMKENLKESFPLNTLFTMLHPASGGKIVSSEQPKGAVGLPVTVTTDNPKAGIIFYEQSMTLLEFFAETEGEQFIGRLGESLARGESMENILRSTRKTPADLTQLEDAWKKWLNR